MGDFKIIITKCPFKLTDEQRQLIQHLKNMDEFIRKYSIDSVTTEGTPFCRYCHKRSKERKFKMINTHKMTINSDDEFILFCSDKQECLKMYFLYIDLESKVLKYRDTKLYMYDYTCGNYRMMHLNIIKDKYTNKDSVCLRSWRATIMSDMKIQFVFIVNKIMRNELFSIE